jgi:hypothetical protein
MHLPASPIASQPEPVANLPLPAMVRRLAAAEQWLDELDAARAEPTNVVQQSGLLNVYVDTMRMELLLARLHLKVGGDTFDLGALLRAAESVADLTADFLATVRSWRDRLAPAVTHAADRMRSPVPATGQSSEATTHDPCQHTSTPTKREVGGACINIKVDSQTPTATVPRFAWEGVPLCRVSDLFVHPIALVQGLPGVPMGGTSTHPRTHSHDPQLSRHVAPCLLHR